MTQKQIIIDVQIKSKVWKNIKNIKNFVDKTCKNLILETELKKFLTGKKSLEMTVSLVCDAQIKKINQEFRAKNKATDVLSFPFLDEKLIRKNGLQNTIKNQQILILGDIVLSLEKSRSESMKSEKTFHNHLTHLLLHSILHLIGFDHENKKDAKIMEELEIKILRKFNIENPYKA